MMNCCGLLQQLFATVAQVLQLLVSNVVTAVPTQHLLFAQ